MKQRFNFLLTALLLFAATGSVRAAVGPVAGTTFTFEKLQFEVTARPATADADDKVGAVKIIGWAEGVSGEKLFYTVTGIDFGTGNSLPFKGITKLDISQVDSIAGLSAPP